MIVDREPPNNLDAEMAVLGAALVDREVMAEINTVLTPSDFYAHVHETIFETLVALFDQDAPLDKITVAEELKRKGQLDRVGGISYLSALMDTVQSVSSAMYYATIVREKADLRALIAAGSEIHELGYSGEADAKAALQDADSALYRALCRSTQVDDGSSIVLTAKTLYMALDGRKTNPQMTPWPMLNKFTGGFYDGEFIAWPASPKQGKSGLVLQLADFVSTEYGLVLFFALEMGKDATARRLMATYSGVAARDQRGGQLSPHQTDALFSGVQVLQDRNLILYGRPKSVTDIRRIALRTRVKQKIAAIIIDHPGWLSDMAAGGRQSEHEKLNRLYISLADLAVEVGCVMHVVQHINREGMSGRPTLKHIRGGGNIEGHAHVIVAPYRPNPYGTPEEQMQGEFCILANRDGEQGVIENLRYIGARHLWLEQSQHLDAYLKERGLVA